MSRIRPVTARSVVGASVINIQSRLGSAPNFCRNVSFAVLFGSNGNSYTFSMQSDVCKNTNVTHKIQTLVGQKNNKKNGRLVNAEWQENFSRAKVRQPRFIPSYERINFVCVCVCVCVYTP